MTPETLPGKPCVKIGERVYRSLNWRRRDEIFLEGQRIGFITQSREDRTGQTRSTITGQGRRGRAIAWCVAEALTANFAHQKAA